MKCVHASGAHFSAAFREAESVEANSTQRPFKHKRRLYSVSRNYFIGDNEDFLLYTHGGYPMAVRNLCRRENIALIDLKNETRALLLSLGAEKSKELFVNTDEIHDKTHFSLKGAQTAAKMVADALKRLGLALRGQLSRFAP